MAPSYLFKIVTVGSSAVGKTSIILRYTTGKFREYYAPTLGADFAIKQMEIDGTRVKLQIWDMGSQDFLGNVRAGYYQGARAVVYMYDVTRQSTFTDLEAWHEEVWAHVGNVVSVVVANKTDLTADRVVPTELGQQMAEKFSAEYVETSVKLNKGVEDVFTTVARRVLSRML